MDHLLENSKTRQAYTGAAISSTLLAQELEGSPEHVRLFHRNGAVKAF
jgi:hypothetical protein